MEDLTFDAPGLFHADTDATLCRLDKDIKASRSLGIATKPFGKQKTFRPCNVQIDRRIGMGELLPPLPPNLRPLPIPVLNGQGSRSLSCLNSLNNRTEAVAGAA